MKKALLFSLLLAFSSLLSFAKVTEKTYSDGKKWLGCGSITLDYPTLICTSLGCIINPNDECYYNLSLAIKKDKIQIKEEQKLSINFEDGSVIKLSNKYKVESKKYTEGKCCIPVYSEIPESEMEQLVSKKITKLSIECKSGILDIDIPDDELSNALKQMYGELKGAKRAHDITDTTNDDGVRNILCKLRLLNYSTLKGVSLACIILPDGYYSYDFYIAISDKNTQISKGKKLLIKLDDGSVLEFKCNAKKGDIVGYSEIPESEIEQLISKRITKIRVEDDSGYIDQDTSDDKLSNALKKLYGQIQEALNAPKKDIYSDF